jgi:asparagine synthase (glutamine-hydrolysing)
MLKLTISLDDAAGPWTRTGDMWRSGRSAIEPVTHPALETITVAVGGGFRITVRERCPGRDGEQHTGSWPGDFVTVGLGQRAIDLHAGQRGIVPLYLTDDSGTLRGSWDLADLYGNVSVARLDAREVARLLTMQFRYGHDTIFTGAYRLTERSTALFTSAGLRLTYPEAAEHGRARKLAPGADVIAAYERLLQTAVTSRAYSPRTACIELSGGLDSANVAATLGALHPGQVTASSMILPGETGIQQTSRRAELITRLCLGTDVPVSFAGRLPLSRAGRRVRGIPVTPYEDPYDGKIGLEFRAPRETRHQETVALFLSDNVPALHVPVVADQAGLGRAAAHPGPASPGRVVEQRPGDESPDPLSCVCRVGHGGRDEKRRFSPRRLGPEP